MTLKDINLEILKEVIADGVEQAIITVILLLLLETEILPKH